MSRLPASLGDLVKVELYTYHSPDLKKRGITQEEMNRMCEKVKKSYEIILNNFSASEIQEALVNQRLIEMLEPEKYRTAYLTPSSS